MMMYWPKADPRAQEFRTWECLLCPSRINRLLSHEISAAEHRAKRNVTIKCAFNIILKTVFNEMCAHINCDRFLNMLSIC